AVAARLADAAILRTARAGLVARANAVAAPLAEPAIRHAVHAVFAGPANAVAAGVRVAARPARARARRRADRAAPRTEDVARVDRRPSTSTSHRDAECAEQQPDSKRRPPRRARHEMHPNGLRKRSRRPGSAIRGSRSFCPVASRFRARTLPRLPRMRAHFAER